MPSPPESSALAQRETFLATQAQSRLGFPLANQLAESPHGAPPHDPHDAGHAAKPSPPESSALAQRETFLATQAQSRVGFLLANQLAESPHGAPPHDPHDAGHAAKPLSPESSALAQRETFLATYAQSRDGFFENHDALSAHAAIGAPEDGAADDGAADDGAGAGCVEGCVDGAADDGDGAGCVEGCVDGAADDGDGAGCVDGAADDGDGAGCVEGAAEGAADDGIPPAQATVANDSAQAAPSHSNHSVARSGDAVASRENAPTSRDPHPLGPRSQYPRPASKYTAAGEPQSTHA